MRGLFVLSILLCCGACSSRDTFEFGHALGRSKADCEALTSMDEREKCERQFDLDYERYQRERKQL